MQAITMHQALQLIRDNPQGFAALYSVDTFYDSAMLWDALHAGDAYVFQDEQHRLSITVDGARHHFVIAPSADEARRV